MGSKKLKNISLVVAGAFAGVMISLGITATAQRDTSSDLPLESLRQFSGVFATIKNNYVESISDKKLIESAIAGMMSSLDPHSSYLDTEAFKDMQDQTQGEFGGLGIEIGSDEGYVKVISPIEDTPAAKAGILAGDLIIKIDNKSTRGMNLADAVKLMRGKPKEPVSLTIMRKGINQPLVITVIRDIIKVKSVRSQLLDDQIAYIRISQFQERTTDDLIRHLNEMAAKGTPKGLILDLRNDPGGLLTGAIGVASAFLPDDVVVTSTRGRTPESKRTFNAVHDSTLANLPSWAKTIPLIVLTNAGSASASEIVAGALQDHGRAKILGTRTFGKGSVQVVLPISQDTGIKLTTSRYYTPKGRSIQASGIEPDYLVTETPDGDLYERPREADLDGHLTSDTGAKEQKSSYSDPDKASELAKRPIIKPIEFGSKEDYQLRQATNVLMGRHVQTVSKEGLAPVDKIPAANTVPETKKDKPTEEK